MAACSKCKMGKDLKVMGPHNERKTCQLGKLESGIWRKRIISGFRNEEPGSNQTPITAAPTPPPWPAAKARPAPRLRSS